MHAPDQEQRIEAAHYALLRRLAFALRHRVARHLQPIGMITDVMERRLESASPDIAQLHESLGKVNVQARSAVQSSLDVIAWLSPDPADLVSFDAGVQDCVELLRSYLNFRGFALRSETAAVSDPVTRAALRSVLPAALLALTDHGSSPAEVMVDARREGSRLLASITMRPAEGNPGFDGELHYRRIEWRDVEALAAAQGIACEHTDTSVTLSLPA